MREGQKRPQLPDYGNKLEEQRQMLRQPMVEEDNRPPIWNVNSGFLGGYDRCMMRKVIEGKREPLEQMTNGADYIRARFRNGWIMVDDPRNHITGDYSDLLGNGGSPAPPHAEDGSSLERNASDHSGDPQPKKRGRPPGSKKRA